MKFPTKAFYRFPLMLFFSCLVCLGIIFWEWQFFDNVQGDSGLNALMPKKQAFVSRETEHKILMPLQNYHEIVSCPLFFSGRKVNEEEEAIPVKDEVDIKLSGVILTPKGFVALIMDDQGGYHKLGRGKDLHGWTVASVEKDRVALIRDQESRELTLFESKNKHDLTAKELEDCFKNQADMPLEECFKHPEKYAHKNENAGVHT